MNISTVLMRLLGWSLLVWLPMEVAIACHTPQRAAILDKQYPDWDFVDMMHKAHHQEYKGYEFRGIQTCKNGMADIYPCDNIDLLGHLDLSQIGGGQGSDSWGWKHEKSGRYFALVGRNNGTSFVEITDPVNPVYLGNLPSESQTLRPWRDIKTYKDHAFIVADNLSEHGMQIFDLEQLLNVANPPTTFSANQLYKGGNFEDAHNIILNAETGFAYLVGGATCAGGLHMVNINDPMKPSFAGCYSDDGYTHDAQCVIYNGRDSEHRGKEICFASNEDTITVIDVTDKSQPVQLSRTGYTGRQYTHQGWLTEDQNYFLIDDELDEFRGDTNTRTYVMDMTDLDNPSFKGFYEADGASIDHNQYVVGDHTFQANYTRGLRVLRLGNLERADMTEVAFFDTFPEVDANDSFSGAWNVYPFFDNGFGADFGHQSWCFHTATQSD